MGNDSNEDPAVGTRNGTGGGVSIVGKGADWEAFMEFIVRVGAQRDGLRISTSTAESGMNTW